MHSFLSIEHQPLTARYSHSTAVVGESLYIWAGRQDPQPRNHDSIEHFSIPSGEWSTRPTTGTPPLADAGSSCCVVGDQIYYFGGWCSLDKSFHNSISQLNTVSLSWNELEPTNEDRAVMRRAWGGMLSFESDGVEHLLMIGGKGLQPTTELSHTKYISNEGGIWRTNEHTLYNLSTSE